MKIWIHIDGAQQGPYELDSLPMDKIDDNTPIWHEGLTGWTRAADVPAVARLLHSEQGIQYRSDMHAPGGELCDSPEQQCPANYLVWSILLTLLCCNPIGIIPIITGSTVRSRWRNHQMQSAARMSETTAWWLMITIVTSLMLAPLTMLMQAM